MDMFERIDRICLTVSNVEQSNTWYQEKLVFQEVFKGEGYRVLSVGNNGIPLSIEEDVTPKENRTYPIFFAYDIEQTYLKIKEMGIILTLIFMT